MVDVTLDNTISTEVTVDNVNYDVTLSNAVVNDITLNVLSSVGGSSVKYELFILDISDIANKYIEVAGTILDNQSIRVFLEDVGIKAEQGIDYSVSGKQIYWNGYELQSTLEIGDKLKIFYI